MGACCIPLQTQKAISGIIDADTGPRGNDCIIVCHAFFHRSVQKHHETMVVAQSRLDEQFPEHACGSFLACPHSVAEQEAQNYIQGKLQLGTHPIGPESAAGLFPICSDARLLHGKCLQYALRSSPRYEI